MSPTDQQVSKISQFETFTTDKVKRLLSIFAQKGNMSDQADITAIVFVQERNMASALASLLIKMTEIEPDKYDHLKVRTYLDFFLKGCTISSLLHRPCFNCLS